MTKTENVNHPPYLEFFFSQKYFNNWIKLFLHFLSKIVTSKTLGSEN